MKIRENVFLPNNLIFAETSSKIFECFCRDEIDVVLLDNNGNIKAGNSENINRISANQQWLKNIRSRIDDGTEPIVTSLDETGVVASELSTSRSFIGYIFILLPGYNPEKTFASMSLIEIILAQISLTADLIEHNHILSARKVYNTEMFDRLVIPSVN